MRRCRFLLPLCVLLLALAAGCKRIPMYEREAGIYLRVAVDQSLDPAQESHLDFGARPQLRDKVVGKMPELVRACFYDAVSHDLVAEDFLPATGGFVDVPAGAYDVIVYSLGTEATQVSGTESRAGGFATTSPTGARVKLQAVPTKDDPDQGGEPASSEQAVLFEPDHLFVGKIAGALVPVRPEEAESVVLDVTLSRLSESWTVEVIDVEGAERIQKAEIYITGQAAGRYLWDARAATRPSALGFECDVDAAKGQLFSVFNTFGRHADPETEVIVNVLVTTNAGARFRYVYDATEQWLNPDNTAHRIVVDERMEIPGDDYPGGGFDPVVNDWDGETIDIIIG